MDIYLNVLFCRDAYTLRRHVGLVHMPRETPVQCPRSWCEEEFNIVFDMNTHKNRCYLVCPVCDEQYVRKDKFDGHLRRHASWTARLE